MNVCLPDVATFATLNVMIYEIMTTSILIGKLRYEFPLSAEYICRYQLEIGCFLMFRLHLLLLAVYKTFRSAQNTQCSVAYRAQNFCLHSRYS